MAGNFNQDVSHLSDTDMGTVHKHDDKADSRHVDLSEEIEVVANANRPNARKEAPASVARLSPEERSEAEKALVRKIDLRLLPMIVIMYIMNYLDRTSFGKLIDAAMLMISFTGNNIAAARLAGLESDLGLTSVQYQVSGLL